jgi:pimeloyl-ACP methyl ester carboxylesterase
MKSITSLLLVFTILFFAPVSHSWQRERLTIKSDNAIVSEERLKKLLTRPSCLKSFSRQDSTYEVQEVTITSGDIKLAGKLFLPKSAGPFPAVVFMHGGGNNYEMLMNGPRFYAQRLAHCGFAALIYDKRGTGKSGGVFHESTYDDFLNDAGHAADFLLKHEQIDPDKIGVYGGSQGGRLAPLVAIRYPSVSFAISASGPIGTLADHATYNIEYALEFRGYDDTTIEQVMPLWKKHHDAWESLDPEDLKAVAEEIFELREYIDPMALPNTRQEFLSDSNLFFLRPVYFSMSKDYFSELVSLDAPWLAFYGELDPIINVQESVDNIQKQMITGNNSNYEMIIIKNVGHSFDDVETGEFTPTENIIVNWINEIISD